MYASYGHYSDGERIEGHAIVATGIDLINNRVYTNNPWGISGSQSYKEFINIFAGGEGDGRKLDACYYLK